MPEKLNRVWVLGAGFSRSLGAPLLDDLLSLNAWTEVDARYGDNKNLEGYRAIYWLYHYGTQFREGVPEQQRVAGVRAWQDPEDFLERLATAVDSAVVQKKIAGLYQALHNQLGSVGVPETLMSPAELDVLGRRLVGAACCAFLDDVDHHAIASLERWQPYRDWFRHLGGLDTLVTFNYDRVIELLNRWSGEVKGYSPINTVATREDAEIAKVARELGRSAPLLKLHGSVDWQRVSDREVKRSEDPRCVLNCKNDQIALATPGPSKSKVAKLLFEAIWAAAESALKTADEIYFLGFRFPPSDSEARSRLLSAIRENKEATAVRFHVVLGPDARDPRCVRLTELLRGVAKQAGRTPFGEAGDKKYGVHVYPMNAEDFLSLWNPGPPYLVPAS